MTSQFKRLTLRWALAFSFPISLLLGSATGAEAQSSPQAAYDQLCGPKGKASAATCAALRKDLGPAGAAPAGKAPVGSTAEAPPQILVAVDSDVRQGGKTTGLMGERYAQHSFQTRPGHYYKVMLDAAEPVSVSICNLPDPNTFSCFGRLDNWTVTQWDMGMNTAETVHLTVKGVKGKGAYRLRVEERLATEAMNREWLAKNAVLKALPGQVFMSETGIMISFVGQGASTEVRIADSTGRFHRGSPLPDMKTNLGKGRFVFSGEEWVAKNVNTFNVAGMVGSDVIATSWDWGWGDHFRLLPSGDLKTTRFVSGAPRNYYTLRRLPPAEAVQVVQAYEAARQRQFQAAQQTRADRDALIGQFFQGALIVGQSYVAGMQEANAANARSQAIIDAAAESDRQYRAAQRAAELAQRAGSQAPVGAQAPTRRPSQGATASATPPPPPGAGSSRPQTGGASQGGL